MHNAKLSKVRKIAILRTNSGLGDLLVCLPAVQALRSTYPDAEIVWLGLAWHKSFLANRKTGVDRVIEMPPTMQIANIALLDTVHELDFFEALRTENFDIVINFQAEETLSFTIIRELRARCVVGQSISSRLVYDRSIPFSYYQHEILRHLHLVELVGVEHLTLQHTLHLLPEERAEAERLIFQQGIQQPFVIIHPGATDIRRCWPTSKFAELADLLMKDGYAILLTGSEQESFVIDEVIQKMENRPFSIFKRLSLGVMAALQKKSNLLISNDTGPLHLARTVGCATIGLYWAPNIVNWGPLYQDKHLQVISWELQCPQCGIIPNNPYPFEPKTADCEHLYSFIASIKVDDVLATAHSLLKG